MWLFWKVFHINRDHCKDFFYITAVKNIKKAKHRLWLINYWTTIYAVNHFHPSVSHKPASKQTVWLLHFEPWYRQKHCKCYTQKRITFSIWLKRKGQINQFAWSHTGLLCKLHSGTSDPLKSNTCFLIHRLVISFHNCLLSFIFLLICWRPFKLGLLYETVCKTLHVNDRLI